MNKKLAIVAVIIVLLIATGFSYLLLRGKPVSDTGSISTPNHAQKQTNMDKKNDEAMVKEGSYIAYSEEALAATKGTKILFFHAAWCPQCRELEASIQSGDIPENVTIFKVDYDNSQALRQKYGVSLQTTLVKVDDSGNALKKYVAYDAPTLEALIENLL